MANKQYDFSDFDEPAKQEASASSYDFSDFKPEEQPSNEPGIAATAVGQGLKGITFGASDRLEGGVAALLRAAGVTNTGGNISDINWNADATLDPEKLKEAYYSVRDQARARSDAQELANPTTALVSNLAGGLVVPGLGVAGAAGKGIGAAMKAGAISGGLAGGINSVTSAKEIEDVNLKDVGADATLGALLGGGLAGTVGVLGKAGSMIKNSDVGQKMGKVFSKTKDGVDLVSKEAPEMFNKQLLGTSGEIVDEVVGSANKFKDQYSKAIQQLKVDVPEKFQDDIDKLINKLSKDQAESRGIDVLTVDDTINKLRQKMDMSEDAISGLKAKIIAAAKAKSEMNASAGYKQAGKAVEAIDTSVENLAQKKQLDEELFQIKEDLLLLREQKSIATSQAEKQEITDEIRQKVKDKFYKEKELKDLGYDISGNKLETNKANKTASTIDKSSRDIQTQTDDFQNQINELQRGKIEDSKQITNLIEGKQELNNKALSDFLKELNILKQRGPETTLAKIKDNNLLSLKSYAKQMGREDLVGKVDDVIKSNIKGAPELDAKYRDMMAGLNELGVKLDESANSVIKNQDAGTFLTQQLKQAAKNPTSDTSNKLQASQNLINNPKVNDLIAKGKSIGENYNLADEIANSNIKSFGLRGAALAGDAANSIVNSTPAKVAKAVVNSTPIKAMQTAASKLGDKSLLGTKVRDVLAMEEGELKNRAIFTLMQQPWFRTVSGSDENK